MIRWVLYMIINNIANCVENNITKKVSLIINSDLSNDMKYLFARNDFYNIFEKQIGEYKWYLHRFL